MPTNANSVAGGSYADFNTSADVSEPTEEADKINQVAPREESDTSLAAHSEFANDFFQNATRVNPNTNQNEETNNLLDALQHIVKSLKPSNLTNHISYPHAKAPQRPSLHSCELPPIEKVVGLIHDPKSNSNHDEEGLNQDIFFFVAKSSG